MKIEEIIQKYNYNDELSNFLKEVYPKLVDYFGDENLVYSSLSNTEIVLCNNVYNCLDERNMLEMDDEKVVKNDNLKQAAGVYCSKPQITYNKLENKYSLDKVDRIIAINANDLMHESTKACLIHEICHLIKSYYKEYEINNDTLVAHSGLINTIYQLNQNEGLVTKKVASEDGVGLEEGLNSVAEEDITSKVIGKEYKSSGYGVVNAVARNVTSFDDNLIKEFIGAQTTHDTSKLSEILGQNYHELLSFTDNLYEKNLKLMSFTISPEERKQLEAELKDYIVEKYTPIHADLKRTFSSERKS